MPIDSFRKYEYMPETGTDTAYDGSVYHIAALAGDIGKTARITAYLGRGQAERVPAELDGIKVTSIGAGAFSHSEIKSVVLPETLRALCADAFADCQSLSEVHLPNGLIHIGEGCFSGAGLTAVNLPDGITEINRGAFYMCRSLKAVCLGKNLRDIGWGALGSCESLENIELPASLKQIDYGAFIFDPIKQMTFPAGLKRVSAGIFNWSAAPKTIECAFKGRETRIIDAGDMGAGEIDEKLVGRVENFYSVKRIYCPKDSRAERYAREHMITFKPLKLYNSEFKIQNE